MTDDTEAVRRELVSDINKNPLNRHDLDIRYGWKNVYDTHELGTAFEVISFAAPFVIVKRRSDGVKGSLEFQHRPRFYYNFIPEAGDHPL